MLLVTVSFHFTAVKRLKVKTTIETVISNFNWPAHNNNNKTKNSLTESGRPNKGKGKITFGQNEKKKIIFERKTKKYKDKWTYLFDPLNQLKSQSTWTLMTRSKLFNLYLYCLHSLSLCLCLWSVAFVQWKRKQINWPRKKKFPFQTI